jgi:hypothetical protein
VAARGGVRFGAGLLALLTAVAVLVVMPAAPASAAPPSNDNFADREHIPGSAGSAGGTTVDATVETGEPDHTSNSEPDGKSAWYLFIPASDGVLALDTCGASFDTVLAAYTGAAVNTLVEVAGNDDSCGSASEIVFPVTAGTEYQIAVAGFGGGSGTFTLTWAFNVVAANDTFALAEDISGLTGSVEANSLGATFETGEPNHAGETLPDGKSVWYRYTAAISGLLTLDTCAAETFDSIIGLYTGSAVDSLTERGSGDQECGNQARLQFVTTAGTTYYIAIAGYQGDAGPFTLTWELGGPTFTDVGLGHQFFVEIEWMAAEGISTGFQPGPAYRPSAPVTRQAMSAFMYRLAGEPVFPDPPTSTFNDVPTTSTFFTEIEWMADEEITTGFPGGLYKPAQAVSRAAMSAFMYRFVGEPPFPDPPTATFNDVPTTSQFFTEIEWMADEEITTGFPGGLYKPAQAVSRAAMSAFMYRLFEPCGC